MVAITGFTGCCGADTAYGFSEDPAGRQVFPRRTIFNPDTARYELSPLVKPTGPTNAELFKSSLESQKTMYARGGRMFCCILTETQLNAYKEGWKRILKREGFQPVSRWTNANHDDPEFLYLFVHVMDNKGTCKGDFTSPPQGWDTIDVTKEVLAQPAATAQK